MKLPEPVAYLHVPLETWGGRIRPVPSLLKYNEPDIYGEVINLYGENQVREALAQQERDYRVATNAQLQGYDQAKRKYEAVMRKVLELLGPQAPECCGCAAEWNEAIKALEDALK